MGLREGMSHSLDWPVRELKHHRVRLTAGFKQSLCLSKCEAEASNTWIGRYKLVRRLGYGGCGVVYAAEQQEPVQRQVALKIIRLGMNTDCVRRYGNNSRVCAARNGGVNVADCGASNLAASRMWRG